MSEETKTTFDCWCVLELFGHVRLAGRVTEASIGGCSFLRVDVPKPDGEIQFTRYFGNGTATAPVKPWEMPKAALPPADNYHEPTDPSFDNEDDDE
jgi:hypothetical protein